MDSVFEGDREGMARWLSGNGPGGYYTYVLSAPDGTPFYVGKGRGDRVLQHELEAMMTSPIRRSNPFKCRRIASILNAGGRIGYRIDRIYPDEEQEACLIREEELISLWKRRCDGGTLTNLAAGKGSVHAPDPFSRSRHAATLSGVSAETPERTALNLFLTGLGEVASVPVKPLSEYRHRLVGAYPIDKVKKTVSRRNALTIAASAIASGSVLAPDVVLPRSFDVVPDLEEWPLPGPPPGRVAAVIENGAAGALLKLALVTLVPAARPEDEAFAMDAAQLDRLIAAMGRDWFAALDLLPS